MDEEEYETISFYALEVLKQEINALAPSGAAGLSSCKEKYENYRNSLEAESNRLTTKINNLNNNPQETIDSYKKAAPLSEIPSREILKDFASSLGESRRNFEKKQKLFKEIHKILSKKEIEAKEHHQESNKKQPRVGPKR